jgi:hypothetical protein
MVEHGWVGVWLMLMDCPVTHAAAPSLASLETQCFGIQSYSVTISTAVCVCVGVPFRRCWFDHVP